MTTRGVSDRGPAVPFQPTSLLGRRVLVLAPHPDDESLGCGGALILHARHHDPVKVVVLTDGAAGDAGNRYRRDEYIALRQREAREACDVLGIADLEFWSFPDGELTPDGAPLDRLVRLLDGYQPTLVYAPSPLEFHPDHRATAALLWRALQRVPPPGEVAFFEYNRPLHVNTLIDITPVIEQKTRACDAYRSQLANYPYTDCAVGLNRYRALTVSAVSRYAEGYVLMAGREIAGRPLETFALQQFLPAPRPAGEAAPLVTIIVRTKDRPARLREALASVLVQTQPDLEVVVVNDGGEDVTGVIEEFARHLDIRCSAHAVSSGRAAAANTGLKLARGKYINFLDDDDLLHPPHVEKLASFLETTGEGVAYSDCEAGRYDVVGPGLALAGPKRPYKGFDFDRERLYLGNYIPIMTAMFRHGLLAEVGLFDESLEFLEDWDFWLRLAARTDFRRLPGVTAEYRMLGGLKYDYGRWRRVVLGKHRRDWTVEELVRVGSRLEALEDRSAELDAALAEERAARRQEGLGWGAARDALRAERDGLRTERDGLRAELERLRHSSPQRLARLVRGRLPAGVVRRLGALLARAERRARQRDR
jgi:LmbE family N-acetylglucosaminyl deacetylase/glycosyltransferase involved in cell wall biosynthesis